MNEFYVFLKSSPAVSPHRYVAIPPLPVLSISVRGFSAHPRKRHHVWVEEVKGGGHTGSIKWPWKLWWKQKISLFGIENLEVILVSMNYMNVPHKKKKVWCCKAVGEDWFFWPWLSQKLVPCWVLLICRSFIIPRIYFVFFPCVLTL